MAAVVIADIKNRIKLEVYNVLTGRTDAVCTRAITTAELWLTGLAAKAGNNAMDMTTELAREVVILRTLSELYSYNGQDETAKDKLNMARELAGSVIGSSANGSPGKPPATITASEYEVASWLTNY